MVSVRGRRLPTVEADRTRRRNAMLIIALAVAAVAAALVLSGVSTQRSLDIAEAREQEKALIDQVEVLERDTEYLRSTAEIARRAAELGMVTPDQPAILVAGPEGLAEVRPAEAEARGIIDLNGAPTRPAAPTSDPAQTARVPGMAGPVVEERPDPGRGALTPYAPAAPPAPERGPAAPPPPAPENAPANPPAPAPAPVPPAPAVD
ncbi:hypothetical protein [Corynebacterium sphenisci]|uniref:hypothetical protein n=1 Tax=Corynebacterium sphenisci TaxID=191493 RepID=UPI0026DFBD55|nr:hypothetical protein [Corynebacterium sphenisci]MDO5731260.1 hypothetical protein [Corynebacterium sphenisci]